MEKTLPTIPEALEFRREQYEWSKTKMAKELNIQLSHYCDVLAERRKLPLLATKHAFRIGVPASVLLQLLSSEK